MSVMAPPVVFTRRWGLDACRAYFGLGDADEAFVAGTEGRRRLLALWDEDPAGYDDHPLTLLRQEWYHAYSPMYRHPGFWEVLDPDDVVLDYGCGVGAVCLPWIGRGGLTRLVDTSAVVLGYLRFKFQLWTAVPQTPEQWARSSFQYDALICTDVLEHVPDPMALQHQLWARLKPGGQALLHFERAYPHAGHLREAVAQFPAWMQWITTETDIVEIEQWAWVRKRQ